MSFLASPNELYNLPSFLRKTTIRCNISPFCGKFLVSLYWLLHTVASKLWKLWKIFLEMSTLLWKQLQEIVCRVIQEDDSCLSSSTCNIVMDHTRTLPINKYLAWATYIHHFPTKLAKLLSFFFKTFVKSRQFVQNVPGKWAVKHALTWQADTRGFPSPIAKWQVLFISLHNF